MGNNIAWSKRIRMVIAAGCIPGTSLAAVGDYFSPRGGWMLPLGLGILAAIAAIAFLVGGTRGAEAITRGDEATAGWWEGPRWKQLGVWVVATFALCSIAFGVWSKNRAEEGGVLGANFSMVARAQQQMGLLETIAVNTGRTASVTEQVRDTVKREVSDNPRKELANLGMLWDSNTLAEAIRRRDLEAVGLFLDGGMRLDSNAMRAALVPNPHDGELAQLLEEKGALAANLGACVGDAGTGDVFVSSHQIEYLMMQDLTGSSTNTRDPYSQNEGINTEKAATWAFLCANAEVERDMAERIKWWTGVQGGKEAIPYYKTMTGHARRVDR